MPDTSRTSLDSRQIGLKLSLTSVRPKEYILENSTDRSGTLYGFTNGFGNISGYLVPEIKRQIVKDESSLSEWRWLFFITAGVNLFTTIVFSIFASPTVQVFNYKSYKSTVKYFTSADFLKFPVKAEPPKSLP